MTRQTELAEFIRRAGWGDARSASLAGDASNRRYVRLTAANGETAVVMDAPPEKGEDVRPFMRIAGHLSDIGLSAPEILNQDPSRGFLLIEDLGDALFARELLREPALETTLYEAATDVLTKLHECPAPDLERYDSAMTLPLAALSFDWYQAGVTGTLDAPAKADFSEAFERVLLPFDDALSVLIQRDYHAENLLWLPERRGASRVGLLDFQDAMLGHPVYDLVSVLQDARRDVTPSTVSKMKARFIAQNGFDRDEFDTAYAVFGLQRNLRILGVFARLCLRDQKPHYVDLIPRVWAHVQTNLSHPSLSEVADIITASLPAPDADVLATLKAKSGSCAGL